LGAILPAQTARESGRLIVQTYGSKLYGASPQNWSVVQDARGVMYFGNTEGLLEYDGVAWRRLRLTNGLAARSLAVDEIGTVYVGGQGEIGYLRAGANGAMEYASLVDRLPAEDRKFADVWSTVATAEGIYFGSNQRIFRWSPTAGMKVWRASKRFSRTMHAGGAVYVLVDDLGLHRLKQDRLEPVPGGGKFSKGTVRNVLGQAGSLLVATGEELFRQSGENFAPLVTGAESYLRENKIYVCRALPRGRFAVGTARGGLVTFDVAGALDHILTKELGLPSDNITDITTDRQGGIWVTTGDGLARVETALTRFDNSSGLQGSVTALARHDGVLYAGTTAGLFRLNGGGWSAVPGLPVLIFVLNSTQSGLLIGSMQGVHMLKDGKLERLLPSETSDLVNDLSLSPRDPNLLYAAGRAGLFLLRRKGTEWVRAGELASSGQEFRSVVEDPDGRVWVTTRLDITRVDFSKTPPAAQKFAAQQGVPAGWKNVYRVGDRVMFATEAGLRLFSEKTGRFEPDPQMGAAFADGSRAVSVVRQDPLDRIWLTGKGYHGMLTHAGGGDLEWMSSPLLRSGIDELYALHIDADGTVWAAGEDGSPVRWQPEGSHPDAGFHTMLRRVSRVGAAAPLYDGAGSFRLPEQAYSRNPLRFEFAAPHFERENAVEYQVMLEGFDPQWSNWSRESQKDYTNLPEGRYTLRLRARSPHGLVSAVAAYPFRVLPPWQRTWWAYSLYVLLFAAAVWGLTRWRTRKLQLQNERLERTVEERTVEIRQQRDQIQEEQDKSEALLLNILPVPVANELKQTGAVQPMTFDDVTVCFTDFAGFTLSSEKIAAADLVATLDEYFTAFDAIVSRYGLEKLKTIGDAYMFAGGLPAAKSSHAVDAVLAALEIVEKAQQLSLRHEELQWKIRVGLHSGPVVAGVVGVRKFAFDIWGPTVNMASRMESSGVPGRVNISGRTYELVRDFIDCESRGPVKTKEGREFEMFFVLGPSSILAGTTSAGVPKEFRRLYEERFSSTLRAYPL
jgi:class 3 adenylate cyclase/sugar lactone lactonase YvrE